LNRSKLTSVELKDVTPGSWHRLYSKAVVEDRIIERNVEQFSNAGTNPFGYTALGSDLGHTRDSLMADAIDAGNLEHPALLDKEILTIVKQLKQHPLLQEIISPILTVEDFRSSF
jgi:hypothetical protein